MTMDAQGNEVGKLFVGGLHQSTTTDGLHNYFSKFGEIEESIVMMDNRTGRSRGFGYVKFIEPASVEQVLSEKVHVIDNKEVDPKKCNINMRGKNRRSLKIFVGGIAFEHDEETIRAFFQTYGTVTDVNLLSNPGRPRHRGFAFVGFDDEEIVKKLIKTHYVNLNGKQVEIKPMEPPNLQKPGMYMPPGMLNIHNAGRPVRGGGRMNPNYSPHNMPYGNWNQWTGSNDPTITNWTPQQGHPPSHPPQQRQSWTPAQYWSTSGNGGLTHPTEVAGSAVTNGWDNHHHNMHTSMQANGILPHWGSQHNNQNFLSHRRSDDMNSEHHHLIHNPAMEQAWQAHPSAASTTTDLDTAASQHRYQHQYTTNTLNTTWPPSASTGVESTGHQWGTALHNSSAAATSNGLWNPDLQHQQQHSNETASAMAAMAAASMGSSSVSAAFKLNDQGGLYGSQSTSTVPGYSLTMGTASNAGSGALTAWKQSMTNYQTQQVGLVKR